MDPKKIAFLFPGQGSQTIGMGMELSSVYRIGRETFEEADEVLGFPLSKMTWKGPARELDDTINTQPALLVTSIAVLRVLQLIKPDIQPHFVAGHSMGQLSALVAAQSLAFPDALRLARIRGMVMKKAGELSPGKMAAILGLDVEIVDGICSKASENDEIVQIANDNCPGQIVISGQDTAIERASLLAKTAGAKRVRILNVSIPAHSVIMTSAQQEFSQAVQNAQITNPEIPIVSNVNAGALHTHEQIRFELNSQLTSRVRWTESVKYMIAENVTLFLELGNKSVLTELLKRIDSEVTGITLNKPDDFDKLI